MAKRPPPFNPRRFIDTLAGAIDYVWQYVTEGVTCPCCGQNCHMRPHKLRGGFSRGLMWLVGEELRTQAEWVYVRGKAPHEFIKNTTDWSIVKHWNLAVPMPKEPGQNNSGYWHSTPQGRDFVFGRATVMSHAVLFNNTLFGFQGKQISIAESLGERFNYQELMTALVTIHIKQPGQGE